MFLDKYSMDEFCRCSSNKRKFCRLLRKRRNMAPAKAPSHAKRPEVGSQSISSMWTQMFPPKPTYTEDQVPDLSGKVCSSAEGGESWQGSSVKKNT